ncbi:MAG: TIGR04211 family SH3 domain-containing protein [Deltaproteobacteria bacterium]|nr:TIGR04211 family SH3 domain-containing protein [Deltaproteobacteria bacterium]MCF8120099.1 TIGR04211 family SH3 domain-containing protein [Deltaproteobacteria bacterium]
MSKFCFIMSLLAGLLLMEQASWAETHYVTDVLKVGVRTGPSLENKITHFLISGQPVEPLESREGWTRVRVSREDKDDYEGWVLSRFLSQDVPWKNQAVSLKEENSVLKEKALELEEAWKEASQNEQRLKADLEKATRELRQLRQEYKILKTGAKDFLELKEKQKATEALLSTLQEKTETLTQENESLRSSQRTKWFATGALVLLCGLMIGLIMGRQQKKKKSLYY